MYLLSNPSIKGCNPNHFLCYKGDRSSNQFLRQQAILNTHTYTHTPALILSTLLIRILIRTQSGLGSLQAQKVKLEIFCTLSVYLHACQLSTVVSSSKADGGSYGAQSKAGASASVLVSKLTREMSHLGRHI